MFKKTVLYLSVLTVFVLSAGYSEAGDKAVVKMPAYVDVPYMPDTETICWFFEGNGDYYAMPLAENWMKGKVVFSMRRDGATGGDALWKGGKRIYLPKGPWTFIQIYGWKKNPPGSPKTCKILWVWKWGSPRGDYIEKFAD